MFAERFKYLREHSGLSQKEIAKILEMGPSTISMWEQDRRSPDKEMLVKIADLFDVSIDYLLGRTDKERNSNISKEQIKIEESEQLLNFLNLANNIPDTQKIDVIFNNKINHLSENENNLIISYFEELGFNISRVLTVALNHNRSDNRIQFETYGDNLYFISRELVKLLREYNSHVEHLKETKGKPKRINGVTNYPV